MGYLNQEHIERFVQGKTIKFIEPKSLSAKQARMHFTDGTFLELSAGTGIITVPYDSRGQVKQSVDIMME